MATNESFIIADTSGLISLAVTTDHNHEQAVAETKRLKEKQNSILVLYEVLLETLNTLGKRFGHDKACAVWVYVNTTPIFLVIDSSSEARKKAVKSFEAKPQAVSLTDCVVMAVADEYSTRDIFGFDKQFQDAGYHRIEPSTEWKEAS